MTDIEKASAELASVQQQIEPLVRRASELQRQIATLRAKAWITSNNVTRDDVQLSDVPGSYFGHIKQFADWLNSTGCRKRFCEWNTRIYFTSDIRLGVMRDDMPATMDDLP